MGFGTSLGTSHEDELSYILDTGQTDKQKSDQTEIDANTKSGDFQSRYGAADPGVDYSGRLQVYYGKPPEASTEAPDALKSETGSQVAPTYNFDTATKEMGLNPQEQYLYQKHLENLTGSGGVDNPDGSRSSLYQSVQEHDGKFYNIPTVWNGKREVEPYTKDDGTVMDVPNATALSNVGKEGWDKYPSYSNPDEADARYTQMHGYMEKDTAAYKAAQPDVHPTPDIEDRRDEDWSGAWHPDGTFAWEKILPTLKSMSVGAGNQLWGEPQIPEAPRSALSDQLGREDMKIDPNVGRGALSNGIDQVQGELNQLGIGKGESWADKLTDPESFSSGTKLGNATSSVLSDKAYGMTVKPAIDAADFIKNIGDAFQGKPVPTWAVDPETGEVHTDLKTIEKSTALAGLLITGPAPVAAKAVDGTLGSFMGVKSATIDKTALYKAQNLEMDGVHPTAIWHQTSTFRGADGRWRQEIPDQDVNILDKGTNLHPAEPVGKGMAGWTKIEAPESISIKDGNKLPDNPSLKDLMKWFESPMGTGTKLSDVLDHPELYKAYPWLKDIKVFPMPEGIPYYGMTRGKDLFMNRLPTEDFTSTLMHEVQHLIQDHEGFAHGANPDMFLPKNLKEVEQQFVKVKSDAEANITKELGLDEPSLSQIKIQIHRDLEGLKPWEDWGKLKTELQNRGVYRQLENIVKSEKLLDNAKTEAADRYRKVMGEVESRNVQARLDFSHLDRAINPPMKTEEIITPRSQQIDSKDIANHTVGKDIKVASEEPPKPANDNVDPDKVKSGMQDKLKRAEEIRTELQQLTDKMLSGSMDEFTLKRYEKLIEEHKRLFPG